MTSIEHYYNVFTDLENKASSLIKNISSQKSTNTDQVTKLQSQLDGAIEEKNVIINKFQQTKNNLDILQNRYNMLQNMDNSKITSLQDNITTDKNTISELKKKLDEEIQKFEAEQKLYNIEKSRFGSLQGRVLNKAEQDEKIRSDYFKTLKEKYLNQLKVLEYQEGLLNRQNIALKNRNETLKEKESEYDEEYDKVSTLGRKLLYNDKDLKFYNGVSLVLKIILIIIAIGVIYLILN